MCHFEINFFFKLQTDAYQATGCYNLLCSGFVQTNNKIAIGAAISPTSSYNGGQFDISLLVWKVILSIYDKYIKFRRRKLQNSFSAKQLYSHFRGTARLPLSLELQHSLWSPTESMKVEMQWFENFTYNLSLW